MDYRGGAMRQDIYVDARCLQDEAYRFRGVGQHVELLLQNARIVLQPDIEPYLIGIVDRDLPPLEPVHSALFDRIQTNGYGSETERSWFVEPSPMTHKPEFVARQLNRRNACRAAIVYDFIPLDLPEHHLATPEARAAYMNSLAWLSAYDVFLAISRSTGEQLRQLLRIEEDRVTNVGVAVRRSLTGKRASRISDHILVIGGCDPRKNVECAIIAHARSALLNARNIRLLIAGSYPKDWRTRLLALHRAEGGKPSLVEFLPHISNETLTRYYGEALVTVCPSRAEGFSLPIIEANANGCPVLISRSPAQMELIPDPEDQFGPDDFDRLKSLMETLLTDPAARQRTIDRQRDIWRAFTEVEVARRFWRAIAAASRPSVRGAAVNRGRRPRIAFATPLPPDPSGVADYSAACVQALAQRSDVHLFTETIDPVVPDGVEKVSDLSMLPYQSGRYDAVVSVLGNSHFHTKIFDLMLDYGGACVAHDARMINFYAVLKGQEAALKVAAEEMGRPVEPGELDVWLHNQRRLPTLFLSEIANAASPLFVHSGTSKKLIKDLYDVESRLLPFAIYRPLPSRLRTPAGRAHARRILNVGASDPLIVTFGGVYPDKAPEECLWSLYMLASWGVKAKLAFAGVAARSMELRLRGLARELGVADQVIFYSEPVSERRYQLFLAASDAAIQLRTYQLGGLSGGLLDCIAAGLPTVANAHLRDAMESPEFIRSVPDGISPVLIAEQLLSILSSPGEREAADEMSHAYYESHNFDVYAERMLENLGFH